MLTAYAATATGLKRLEVTADQELPENAVWLDLLLPTLEEDKLVERAVGVSVPTREEMSEIEASSRLYVENRARYMTALLICQSETERPFTTPTTFILAGKHLVTVRYDEPRSFAMFSHRACKGEGEAPNTSEGVLIGILEAAVDRTADVMEKVGADIDGVSSRIFDRDAARVSRKKSYQAVLKSLGRKDDLLSKARESLATISRVATFLSAEIEGLKPSKEAQAQLRTLQRDVQSINDYAAFLGNKVTFLLDALVGMVSVEQNDIIKLFSVVAVVMMPPTLVASIYGMNFRHMPELDWPFGYPMALIIMVISAILPYVFFKWRRWL
ncbi:magnesium transporter [Agaricicola taiwanensis]|uniref:Magnesium transport protein CorA n=1 Tax=Agaricicola taiwanensis TaxID=591372 RepID=A0A8J2VU91_9RHOB|nr:magnesium transporter CorA family protein [Agaricicola taiwanensis]GGE35759.1 magnesium transporter [Agaricicola taiwanensis]